MKKIVKNFDFVYLTIIGALIIISYYQHFFNDDVLTINFYSGFICWMLVVFFTIKNDRRAKTLLLILLLLCAFNIISFCWINFAFGSSSINQYKGIYFCLPSINPVFLILLVIYSLTDTIESKNVYQRLFGKSESEIDEEYKKEEKFYLKKFNNCTADELNFAMENFKQYPKAAQAALDIVIAKKKEVIDLQ